MQNKGQKIFQLYLRSIIAPLEKHGAGSSGDEQTPFSFSNSSLPHSI